MHGDVISPELALVDPATAAAHRARLPAVVLDSAIELARVQRALGAPAATRPGAVEIPFALPVWLAATTYVVVKVALAVLFAVALVGSVALVGTVLPL